MLNETQFRIGTTILLSVGLSLNVGGCSGADEETKAIGVVGQYSTSMNSIQLWTMPIDVCFVNGDINGDGTFPTQLSYLAARGEVMAQLQATWGSVPGVQLNDAGDCDGSEANALTFHLVDTDPSNGGWCSLGVGAVCQYSVGGPNWRSGATHEFGHGLGLMHEHQRGLQYLCPWERGVYDSCLNIVNSGLASYVSASDWNTCFLTNVGAPMLVVQLALDLAQQRVDNRDEINSSIREDLTVYDEDSIMHYCSGGPETPTSLDLLGLEILYSRPTASCSEGCFETAGGVVVREGGTVTTDWYNRGANSVEVMVASAPNTWGPVVGTDPLDAEAAAVLYVRWPYGVHASNLSYVGVVTKSDALHAAIAVSVL